MTEHLSGEEKIIQRKKQAALERLKKFQQEHHSLAKATASKKEVAKPRPKERHGLENTILSNKLGEDTTFESRQRVLERMKKPIRVDLNIANYDEFLEYLKTREPARQKRDRYKEPIKDTTGFKVGRVRRNTFVDNKSYDVDTDHVIVYINGRPSSDFNIHVKNHDDSVELYLDYKYKRKYKRERFSLKAPSVKPAVKELTPKEETESPDGAKKIFGTVMNLDGFYRWMKNGKRNPETDSNDKPSVQYLGTSGRKRRNVFERFASVEDKHDGVNIHVDIPDIEEMTDDLATSTIQSILEELQRDIRQQLYHDVFGQGSIVDRKLEELVNSLVSKDRIMSFAENESLPEVPSINIDSKQVSFSASFKTKEYAQRGNGSKENCSFKAHDAEVLITEKEDVVMFRSELSKSIMYFDVAENSSTHVAYFLYSFFSSDCRYKRSLPPLQILKSLGVRRLRKAYSKGTEGDYYLYDWIYIRNPKDERQNAFIKSMKELGME